MKYIKYLLFIGIVSMLFAGTKVQAMNDSFYEGEKVTNAYLKKFAPGSSTGKYEQMRMFRRTSDNKIAYCIELWKTLSNETMVGYDSNYLEHANITQEQWERIQLISYYGYDYKNHTTDNWYAASQFLIWKTLEPESTIYFTDTLNGNRVEKFVSEINEIENLVKAHYILPSYANMSFTLSYGRTTEIADYNHVSPNFKVISDKKIKTSTGMNGLTIEPTILEEVTLNLIKENEEEKTILYVSEVGQNIIVRGDYPKIETNVKINVNTGTVRFQKVDSETGKSIPEGEATFDETMYEIYDQYHHLIKTITFTNQSPTVIEKLPYGKLLVKEIKSGKGYQLDETIHEIIVNDNQKVIECVLKDKVYEGKVIIQKYYEKGNNLIKEKNAEFEIYNSKNEIIKTVKTNQNGKIEITLPYGNYKVHQIKGQAGHELVEDFLIEVKEEKNQVMEFILNDSPLKRYLKVVKLDQDTKKEIIVGNATFKIKNLDTGEYVKQKITYPKEEIVELFTTNNEGFFLTPEPLLKGNYQLEEVQAPNGYKKLDIPIKFVIDNTIDTINEKYGKIIILEVMNESLKGEINILKKGEIFKVEDDRYYYEYQPLENISFNIYADEDIIRGDGKKIYSKDELICERKTNQDGNISIYLPMGKYYVMETTFLDGYIENMKKYSVELTNDNLNQNLRIYNYLKKGSLKIYKKDSMTKMPISDTYFSIFTEDEKLLKTITTDENGEALIDFLPLGKYKIEEVKSNPNYKLDHSKIEIELKEEQVMIPLEVENTKLEIIPPYTEVNQNTVKRCLLIECGLEMIIAFMIMNHKKVINFKKKYK